MKLLSAARPDTVRPIPNGWYRGEYFSNRELSGTPVAKRTERPLSFDFCTCHPAHDRLPTGVPEKDMSARWNGEMLTTLAGDYDLVVRGRGGVGARQKIEVGHVLRAAGPHFLAVDEISIAVFYGGGFDRSQVGTGVRLGHCDGLPRPIVTGDVAEETTEGLIAGISEIARDGIEATLVAPGDTPAWAEALARMLRTPETGRVQAARARVRIESEYTAEIVLPAHTALACAVAAGKF